MKDRKPQILTERIFDDRVKWKVPTEHREFEHQWELYKARFEYAWRYFDFHAKQRTTMFNFFVVFSGFLVNACILLLQAKQHWVLITFCVFGILITIFFIFLERRNEELVHVAEDILRALEYDVLFKDMKREIDWPKRRNLLGVMKAERQVRRLGIFTREDVEDKSTYFHGRWLPIIQVTIAVIYLVFISQSVWQLVNPELPLHVLWWIS